jgi:hypothetical protein
MNLNKETTSSEIQREAHSIYAVLTSIRKLFFGTTVSIDFLVT